VCIDPFGVRQSFIMNGKFEYTYGSLTLFIFRVLWTRTPKNISSPENFLSILFVKCVT